MLARKKVICTIMSIASIVVWQHVNAFESKIATGEFFERQTSQKQQNDSSNVMPREGKYLIESFGYNDDKPLKIGYFTLGPNQYKYYDLDDKVIDSGAYVFDAASKQIKWQTGRFKKIGWKGNFTSEQNGKTHIVQLNNTTVAKNTSL